MKNIFLAIITTVFIASPIVSFGQDTIAENTTKEKRISYAFINEYGGNFGAVINDGFFWGEIIGVFVNGICFNKTQNEIGIGIGTEHMFIVQTFPIYFNYRHYFPTFLDVTPLINIAVGTRLSRWADHLSDRDPTAPHKVLVSAGLYSTIAGGFKVKSFSLTAGAFLKSLEFLDNYYFIGAEIKVGFTF